MNKKILLFLLGLVALSGIVYFLYQIYREAPRVNSFDDCVKAGYPVMESYPRQCKNAEGKTFREDIGGELLKDDLIRVAEPRPNSLIESPLVIRGMARGGWFFEASFPVSLIDSEGNVLSSGIAKAEGEWMTEDFVPFSAALSFNNPKAESGKLILSKDNPSDMREHDDSLEIPVKFKKVISADNQGVCRPTGCGGEVCADQNMVSICLYRSEFACYKAAKCERQKSGECGWTVTNELKQCLIEKKSNSSSNSDLPQ